MAEKPQIGKYGLFLKEKDLENFKQLETSQAKQKVKEKKEDSHHKISYQEKKDLDKKINAIRDKLKNKSFLKNAPKQIVEKEKKVLIVCKIELKKLNSILNSIKN